MIQFLTDPDAEIKGLSGFVLSGLMQAHQEKTYLVTTLIRFSIGLHLHNIMKT